MNERMNETLLGSRLTVDSKQVITSKGHSIGSGSSCGSPHTVDSTSMSSSISTVDSNAVGFSKDALNTSDSASLISSSTSNDFGRTVDSNSAIRSTEFQASNTLGLINGVRCPVDSKFVVSSLRRRVLLAERSVHQLRLADLHLLMTTAHQSFVTSSVESSDTGRLVTSHSSGNIKASTSESSMKSSIPHIDTNICAVESDIKVSPCAPVSSSICVTSSCLCSSMSSTTSASSFIQNCSCATSPAAAPPFFSCLTSKSACRKLSSPSDLVANFTAVPLPWDSSLPSTGAPTTSAVNSGCLVNTSSALIVPSGFMTATQEDNLQVSTSSVCSFPTSVEDLSVEYLNSGAVICTGCHDQGSSSNNRLLIIIFSQHSIWSRDDDDDADDDDYNDDVINDMTRIILYYYSITRENLRVRGLTLLVDARISGHCCRTKTLHTMSVILQTIKKVEERLSGVLRSLMFLVDDNCSADLIITHHSIPGIKISIIDKFDELHAVIGRPFLPVGLGGVLKFDQIIWVKYRQTLESFVTDCHAAAAYLVQTANHLAEITTVPTSANETRLVIGRLEELRSAAREQEELMVRLERDGEKRLAEINGCADHVASAKDFCETPVSCRELLRAVQNCCQRLRRLTNDVTAKLGQCLQLQEFEERTKNVLAFFSVEGAQLLEQVESLPMDNLQTSRQRQQQYQSLVVMAEHEVNSRLNRSAETSPKIVVRQSVRDGEYQNLLSAIKSLTQCTATAEVGRVLQRGGVDGEGGILQRGGVGEAGIKAACKVLRESAESFNRRIHTVGEHIDETVHCFETLDQLKEWATESTEFTSNLQLVGEPLTSDQIICYLSRLNVYLMQPLNFDVTDTRISRLSNDSLVNDWTITKLRCAEIEALIRSKIAELQQIFNELFDECSSKSIAPESLSTDSTSDIFFAAQNLTSAKSMSRSKTENCLTGHRLALCARLAEENSCEGAMSVDDDLSSVSETPAINDSCLCSDPISTPMEIEDLLDRVIPQFATEEEYLQDETNPDIITPPKIAAANIDIGTVTMRKRRAGARTGSSGGGGASEGGGARNTSTPVCSPDSYMISHRQSYAGSPSPSLIAAEGGGRGVGGMKGVNGEGGGWNRGSTRTAFDVRGYMLRRPDGDPGQRPGSVTQTPPVVTQTTPCYPQHNVCSNKRMSADCSGYELYENWTQSQCGLDSHGEYLNSRDSFQSVYNSISADTTATSPISRVSSTLPQLSITSSDPPPTRRQRWKIFKKAISLLSPEGGLSNRGGSEGVTRPRATQRSSWGIKSRPTPPDVRTASIESLPGYSEDYRMVDMESSFGSRIQDSALGSQVRCLYGWSQVPGTIHHVYSNRHAGAGGSEGGGGTTGGGGVREGGGLGGSRHSVCSAGFARRSSISDQSSVTDSCSDEALRKQRALTMVMRELVSTEHDYVASLRYVIDHYVPEMLREDIVQPLRGKKNVIFENIEKIYEFHARTFQTKLELCQAFPFQLGSCFLQHESEFYLYALYNKNKPKSDRLMTEYGSDFFKTKQQKLNDKMNLSSYLLKPVQRISKYSLLLREIMKECPTTDPNYPDLQAALEMVRFQLRHGNNLLAMDCLRDCDVNIQEQGMLLRQEPFLVYHGRKKCLRHVFLFEELVLFSKAKHSASGQDTYIYKHAIKTSDLGLTESVGDSGCRFEIWFRKRIPSATYLLQATSSEIKTSWTLDISRLLWKQTLRNRERRLEEMACMGIGSKPSFDIKQSADNINDRLVDISISKKSISISQNDQFKMMRTPVNLRNGGERSLDGSNNGGCNKRPHSLISVSSSSSSASSGLSSGYGSGMSALGCTGAPGLALGGHSFMSTGYGGASLLTTTQESPLELAAAEETPLVAETLQTPEFCLSLSSPSLPTLSSPSCPPLCPSISYPSNPLPTSRDRLKDESTCTHEETFMQTDTHNRIETEKINTERYFQVSSDAYTQTTLKRPTTRKVCESRDAVTDPSF